MQALILALHVLVAVCIMALVLVQHGKGADAGAAFGSGASNTMFGSQGASSFLLKITAVLALLFFATSLGLGYLTAHQVSRRENLLNLPKAMPIHKQAKRGRKHALAPKTFHLPKTDQ